MWREVQSPVELISRTICSLATEFTAGSIELFNLFSECSFRPRTSEDQIFYWHIFWVISGYSTIYGPDGITLIVHHLLQSLYFLSCINWISGSDAILVIGSILSTFVATLIRMTMNPGKTSLQTNITHGLQIHTKAKILQRHKNVECNPNMWSRI